MDITAFISDPGALMDIAEILLGFVLGIGARLRFMKPKDITIAIQVILVMVRISKTVLKKHQPLKRPAMIAGVDQELTKMYHKILKDHDLHSTDKITQSTNPTPQN